jgi:hypothetical protein
MPVGEEDGRAGTVRANSRTDRGLGQKTPQNRGDRTASHHPAVGGIGALDAAIGRDQRGAHEQLVEDAAEQRLAAVERLLGLPPRGDVALNRQKAGNRPAVVNTGLTEAISCVLASSESHLDMRRVGFVLPVVLAGGLAAFPAETQAQAPIAGCRSYRADGGLRVERSPGRQLLIGSPEAPWRIECDEVQFFADTIELLLEPSLIRATGHVLFVSGGSRIAADRMEFDTTTRTGTFYHASATLALGDRVDRSLFGAQEPAAFLYGETVEKLGPKKYRLTRGGFTTSAGGAPQAR